jgi:hypothetical protein
MTISPMFFTPFDVVAAVLSGISCILPVRHRLLQLRSAPPDVVAAVLSGILSPNAAGETPATTTALRSF